MSNLTFNFQYPWLLLLIIPAVALTLFPYFRLSKKYRRTRNRIISIVLHVCILVMCVGVLSGFTVEYDKPNNENEIILLVDASYSSREIEEQRDAFIHNVLSESNSRFKMGVVTFGCNQVYAAELSNDSEEVYQAYKKSLVSSPVDDSATDIASALHYAKSLLANPQTAKIILISDGVQTDGDALTAVKQLTAEGIKISTVSYVNAEHDEVQLIDITLPNYNVKLDEQFSLGLTVQSSFQGEAVVTLYDNDARVGSEVVDLVGGVQEVTVYHALSTYNLHELRFEISSDDDTITQNNRFYSYMYLNDFKDVLILENFEGEGVEIRNILADYYNYTVDLINLRKNPELIPPTLMQLRNRYQQVILVNVSNDDLINAPNMPQNFPYILNQFVQVAGGGVFAIGGCEPGTEGENPVAHAFNQADMATQVSRDLRELLPVEIIPYHPPIGVVFLIDRSDSMTVTHSELFDLAKESALSCLDALQYRDYVGVVTLDTSYVVNLDMHPVLDRVTIEDTIKNINKTAGNKSTLFGPALREAYDLLSRLGNKVVKKHIIFLTDGQPHDKIDEYVGTNAPYGPIIDNYYNNGNGITLSVISMANSDSVNEPEVRAIAERGGGSAYFIPLSQASSVVSLVKTELAANAIVEVKYEQFTPQIGQHSSIVQDVDENFMPTLGGVFGVRPKDGAVTSLESPYAPLYSQWNFGRGKSGAFMCSLSGGAWSAEFLASTTGQTILSNIVKALMPTEDISTTDIRADMRDDNYSTRLSIMTDVDEGESIEVTITSSPEDENAENIVQTIIPSVNLNQTRVTFTIVGGGIKRNGLHKIVVRKLDARGVELSRLETYKILSYSAEYNGFVDSEQALAFMAQLAESGNGSVIAMSGESSGEVFTDFAITMHKVVDPRLLFMILSIVFFLLDVAVRKFKFKWPHELYRDYQEKKKFTNNKR